MPEVRSEKRVAVYIDAENIRPALAPAILARAAELGRLTLVRCHGNAMALGSWQEAIGEHAMVPALTPMLAQQKNASDFALVIDAVAQANRGRFDMLVLASSDGDYQLLALHLRELGIACHAVCENNTATLRRSAFASVTVANRPEVAVKQGPARLPGTKPLPAAAGDVSAFRSAALQLLGKQSSMSLSMIGKSLKSTLGERYPNGRLTRHLKQFPDHFRIDAQTVHRVK